MFLSQPVRAYVQDVIFTMSVPAGLRIEMEIRVEDQKGALYDVPLAITDKNWELKDGILMYKQDSEYAPEVTKYKVLKNILNVHTQKPIETTPEKNEWIKQQIFQLCEGELVYYRSVVEVCMFDCFSEDFDDLPEQIQEKLFAYFS